MKTCPRCGHAHRERGGFCGYCVTVTQIPNSQVQTQAADWDERYAEQVRDRQGQESSGGWID